MTPPEKNGENTQEEKDRHFHHRSREQAWGLIPPSREGPARHFRTHGVCWREQVSGDAADDAPLEPPHHHHRLRHRPHPQLPCHVAPTRRDSCNLAQAALSVGGGRFVPRSRRARDAMDSPSTMPHTRQTAFHARRPKQRPQRRRSRWQPRRRRYERSGRRRRRRRRRRQRTDCGSRRWVGRLAPRRAPGTRGRARLRHEPSEHRRQAQELVLPARRAAR